MKKFSGHIIFKTLGEAHSYKALRGKWFNEHHRIIKAYLPSKNTINYFFVGYMLQLTQGSNKGLRRLHEDDRR